MDRRSFIAGLLASTAAYPLAASAETLPLTAPGFSTLTCPIPTHGGCYDVFLVNDGGVLKVITGPAWDDARPGMASRGTASIIKDGEIWKSADGKGLYAGSLHVGERTTFWDYATKSTKQIS